MLTAALLAALRLPAAGGTIVSLTFDDGVSDQTTARQVLDERGLKATFFVNSAQLGSSGYYMTLEQVRAIAASGHEIGGHSLHHPNLTTLNSAELRREICDDRATLSSWGFQPGSFAYPFGSYDAETEAAARDCGYASARGVGNMNAPPLQESLPPADRYALRAPESMHSDTTLAQMQRYVTDVEKAGGGWAILVLHHVCDGCNVYATSAATLGSFLDWLKPRAAQGTVVRTIGEALGGPAPPEAPNPAPVLSSLIPCTAPAGSPPLTMTVKGSGFVRGSMVAWNGVLRVTTYIDEATLTVELKRADLASVGPRSVSVISPAPGGGTSAPATFEVVAALTEPVLAAIVPHSAAQGGTGFTLSLQGSFGPGSIARWNGSERPTTNLTDKVLLATISSEDLRKAGAVQVSVRNAAGTSAPLTFTVTLRNPEPALSSITPSSAAVCGPAFTLVAHGSGFVRESVVRWGGIGQPTAFVDHGTLRAFLPAAALESGGRALVTVFNPEPGGGGSDAAVFTVWGQRPTPAVAMTIAQARGRPNPWRADRHAGKSIVFDQMPTGSTVKVYTAAGRQVKSLDARAGSASWDLTNEAGETVASGLYLFVASDGAKDRRGLLAIIR